MDDTLNTLRGNLRLRWCRFWHLTMHGGGEVLCLSCNTVLWANFDHPRADRLTVRK